MGSLIFNGVSTETLQGVYVSQMPAHKKAERRNTEYYVNGRDGALHVMEGYSNYDITAVLSLVNASVDKRYAVNAWATGSGKLITSDDPARAYKATVIDEIEWTRTKANSGYYDTATITFNCQPFMVEAIDSVVTLTSSGTLTNIGSAPAYPMIQVNGSGDVRFTFAGYSIAIDSMTSGVPVYIDCENGYVYTASGATSMTGEIPVITEVSSSVVFGSGLSSLVITPHWRWI